MVKEKKQFPPKADLPQAAKIGSPNQNKFGTGQAEGIAKAVTFLKEMLGKEGNLIKATKKDDGWEVEIEVVEQSEYMKRIGIAKPVYDKNIYQVLLDRNFELISYERRGQKPFGGAAE